MLYAQKRAQTAPTVHAQKKNYFLRDNSFTVYSMLKKYAIYSLKI